jgi:Co/Zn/Cd efflux system component
MRRHPTDLVGLLFGSAFLIAGVGFLVRETTDAVVNPAWVAGLGLMLLGAIALVATLARGIRHRADEHDHDFYGYAPAYAPTSAGMAPQETMEAAVTSETSTSTSEAITSEDR